MSEEHSLFSPSGAHRWLKCSKSLLFEKEETSSSFANEGKEAHNLAEALLNNALGVKTISRETLNKYKNTEMYDECSKYVRHIIDGKAEKNIRGRSLKRSSTACYYVERKVTLAEDARVFGTSDCIIFDYEKGILEIVDFKYGKGVEVSSKENPQLMMYALMAYDYVKENFKFPEDTVFRKPFAMRDGSYDWRRIMFKLTVIQPRVNNNSSWTTTFNKLKEFRKTVLKTISDYDKEELNYRPDAEVCRWCGGKGSCSELTALTNRMNKIKESEKQITKEQRVFLIKNKKLIENFLDSLYNDTLERMKGGETFGNFELAYKHENRKWKADAEEKLYEKFQESIYNKKLKGIVEFTKDFGEDAVKGLIEDETLKEYIKINKN